MQFPQLKEKCRTIERSQGGERHRRGGMVMGLGDCGGGGAGWLGWPWRCDEDGELGARGMSICDGET